MICSICLLSSVSCFAASLSSRRSKVLTVHGKDDATIPVADAFEFDRVLLNHELVVVEGATHNFATAPEQMKVIEALAPYVVGGVDPSAEN